MEEAHQARVSYVTSLLRETLYVPREYHCASYRGEQIFSVLHWLDLSGYIP